jgi:hypothetical protein
MIKILLLLLIIIIIIFIKLYFFNNENFTSNAATCPNQNNLIKDLVKLYGITNNFNSVLQTAKTNVENLRDHQELNRLFSVIPTQFNDCIDKINIYVNTLLTDRFNKSEIDNKYENFKNSIIILETYYNNLSELIYNYNLNTIKQNYDIAINDFQLSYINYDNKLNLYRSCFLT